MANIEDATIRMYEDTSLTEELTDEPATALLKWGEGHLAQMVTTAEDDETFEARFKQLRLLMKSINRFIGRRADMPDAEQIGTVWKILDAAKELGFNPNYGELNAYLEKQKTLPDADIVKLLTHFIQTGSTQTGSTQTGSTQTGLTEMTPPQAEDIHGEEKH